MGERTGAIIQIGHVVAREHQVEVLVVIEIGEPAHESLDTVELAKTGKAPTAVVSEQITDTLLVRIQVDEQHVLVAVIVDVGHGGAAGSIAVDADRRGSYQCEYPAIVSEYD